MSRPITIQRIKNIADDIIESNEEWVNDSHSASEYEGMVNALHMLIEHLEEVSDEQGYEIPYTGGDSALSPDDLQEGA
tara:strand:- start:893 stop:1126 length:234 start_codon:yes stop_codon:yes gene_type:complete